MSPSRTVVVSPHLDDAVLSATFPIAQENAEVVTVFAGSPSEQVGPGWWDDKTGAHDPRQRVAERIREDDAALAELGAGPAHRLPFLDGQHRVGQAEPADLIDGLGPLLRDADTVWAPAAVGGHADHVAVRQAVQHLHTQAAWRLVLYADVPYCCGPSWYDVAAGVVAAPEGEGWLRLDPVLHRRKRRAAARYVTQLPALGLPEDVARNRGHDPLAVERRWIVRPAAPDLCVIGDVNLDVICPLLPSHGSFEQVIEPIWTGLGGSGALTARAATKLGLRVALIASMGADGVGHWLAAELQRAGVNRDGVSLMSGHRTGTSLISGRDEDRRIATDPGALRYASLRQCDRRSALEARHLHVSGFYLNESLRADLPALLDEARNRGITTSLDTNFAPAGDWAAVAPVLARVDHWLPNLDELRFISHSLGGPIGGEQEIAELVRPMMRPGLTIIVKAGAAGAYGVINGVVEHVPAPRTPVVNPTGGGDALAATYLATLLSGRPTGEALRAGVAAGSRAVSTSAAARRMSA